MFNILLKSIREFLKNCFMSFESSPAQISSHFLCWYSRIKLKQFFKVAPIYSILTLTLVSSKWVINGITLVNNLWGPCRHFIMAIRVNSLQYFATKPGRIAAEPKSPCSFWTKICSVLYSTVSCSFKGCTSAVPVQLVDRGSGFISNTIYLKNSVKYRIFMWKLKIIGEIPVFKSDHFCILCIIFLFEFSITASIN